MDNFVTIKTFTYPSDLIIIRGRLESEGIECVVQDELTVQVDPFYSNAIGGIKLKVRESQLQDALQILKEAGQASDGEDKPTRLYTWLDQATADLGLIGKMRVEYRLLLLVGLLASLTLAIVYAKFQR